jgi:predicted phosphodiesterase
MLAIISDIHGNLEALQAVLADAKENGVREIICLGDLVGYGPDPLPCVELAMEWPVVVLGNFDVAALSEDDLPGFTARIAAETIFQFRRDVLKQQKMQSVYPYLHSLPKFVQRTEALYVHGSPRAPTNEYLHPEDIHEPKLIRNFERFSGVCFCGHTHLPGIFLREPQWDFLTPAECGDTFTRGQSQLLCNVGSVGQPRDNDWRACYVLFDGTAIRFRRLEYNIRRTIRKLREIGLPDAQFLMNRLTQGR